MYSSAVKPLISLFQHTAARRRLEAVQVLFEAAARFNTQPPEGGWVKAAYDKAVAAVSTHSRPKAAGQFCGQSRLLLPVSTHSRPKAAGSYSATMGRINSGFNTQPPEGGWFLVG